LDSLDKQALGRSRARLAASPGLVNADRPKIGSPALRMTRRTASLAAFLG
jgi:hypothetical protein